MDDEWQQTAFSSRHMHNRNAGNNKTNRGPRSGKNKQAFDVRHMFGTYSFDCPKATGNSKIRSRAVKKTHKGSNKRDACEHSTDAGVLEVYRMTEDGKGMIGSLFLPVDVGDSSVGGRVSESNEVSSEVPDDHAQQTKRLLEATVIFAGSRKVMRQLINNLSGEGQIPNRSDEQFRSEHRGTEEGGKEEEAGHNRADASSDDGERESSSQNEEDNTGDDLSDESDEDGENRYQKPFEKNSFRSPKFWVEWREVTTEAEQTPPTPLSGTAYLVFQVKDCRKFSGTISCPSASWDNLAVSGHKLASSQTRDTAASWPQ